MISLKDWKAQVSARFPSVEFIDECDGMTARANDADCGWWLASSFGYEEPDCWIAERNMDSSEDRTRSPTGAIGSPLSSESAKSSAAGV